MMQNKLVIFRGDDAGGAFGRKLEFVITAAEGVSLDGCRAEWVFDGVVKRFDAPLVDGETREIFYSHNETARMRLGVRRGVFRVIDAAGKVRTLDNTVPVEVTDSTARAYAQQNAVAVRIGTGITWEMIEGKPDLVLRDDIRAANLDEVSEAVGRGTQKEIREALLLFVDKVKALGTAAATAMLALSTFAAVTRDTVWEEVPPETPLGEVADLATNSIRSVDGAARPLPPYLHALDFDDTYPEDAAWYCDRIDRMGYCSSVRRGNAYARNFDWFYDDAAAFVVRVSAGVQSNGAPRFASVGVSAVGTNLSEQVVTSGRWSRFYKCLPGMTLDGINENGVVCNINVVETNGAPWEASGDGRDLNILCAVRWTLDNATNAATAARHVAERAYVPPSIRRRGFSIHMMVADERETWVVEDGEARRVGGADDTAAMTNFRVFDPAEPFGTGYERYGILTNGGPAAITSAWFKAAYDYPFTRLTELAGGYDAEGRIPHTATERLRAWAEANVKPMLPPKRRNGGGFWQTVHTSIYDISNRTLRVAVQEVDDWYTFAVPGDAGLRRRVEGVEKQLSHAAVRLVVEGDTMDVVEGSNVVWSSVAGRVGTNDVRGLAAELIAKTNVNDFADAATNSIAGMLQHAAVRLVVEGDTMDVVEGSNVVWTSENGGRMLDLARGMVAGTNVNDFADAATNSVAGLLQHAAARIVVEGGRLSVLDGTNVIYSGSMVDASAAKVPDPEKVSIFALANKLNLLIDIIGGKNER